jgi:hypothetical protein
MTVAPTQPKPPSAPDIGTYATRNKTTAPKPKPPSTPDTGTYETRKPKR